MKRAISRQPTEVEILRAALQDIINGAKEAGLDPAKPPAYFVGYMGARARTALQEADEARQAVAA